jgi:RNA polymerase sporulation-specific sigma factor
VPVRLRQPLSTLTDPELAEAAQRGDADARDLLLRRHRRLAQAKSRKYFIVGGDRDDLEQEALIGLFKAVRDYRPEHLSSFRTFAELCITRQVITAIKSATRQKHQPLNKYVSISGGRCTTEGGERGERSDEEILPAVDTGDPADMIVAVERILEMRAALGERLSALEVDVLSRYVAGHSYQDIGEELGRQTKAIDNAIQRIKRKLDDHLRQEAASDAAAELAMTA